jgi:uncharacterized protein YdaT
MPLVAGKTPEAIEANIRQLIKDGYEQKQAVAIAESYARRMEKKKKNG